MARLQDEDSEDAQDDAWPQTQEDPQQTVKPTEVF